MSSDMLFSKRLFYKGPLNHITSDAVGMVVLNRPAELMSLKEFDWSPPLLSATPDSDR